MSLPDTSRSKGEQKFIHEFTRTLLIKWGEHQIMFGQMPKCGGLQRSKAAQVFVDYAITKGWVSKSGEKVTSAGFLSAAGRLKS